MKLILLHEAEIEFWKSVEYYERQQSALGMRFKEEVDRHLQQILAQPLLPSLRKAGYRRVNLTVFRHYIAYIVRDDVLWVIAICHSHRKPEFWLARLP
jgi:hypothetical protein